MGELTDQQQRELRTFRTVTVAYPWAWSWWHPTDLVHEDPDITDQRPPRPISTIQVNWDRILEAVRYAVNSCPADLETVRLEPVQVELPMPLTGAEHMLVSGWVGAASPVIYRYQDATIEDGRHRLWLSREAAADQPVPVVASSLFYLDDALAAGPTASMFADVLEESRLWWIVDADPAVSSANRDHQRHLALAYLELTSPAPLPAHWFRHLHNWADDLLWLARLHTERRTSPELLAAALPTAWRFRQDDHGLDPDLTRDMFRSMAANGCTMAGEPTPRPLYALTLYRGATPANRCGVSWSVDPEIAQHFARHRQAHGQLGRVWKIRVPPDRLLAFFPDENEFIVDLVGAEDLVRPAPDSAIRDFATRWWAWRLRRLDERRS